MLNWDYKWPFWEVKYDLKHAPFWIYISPSLKLTVKTPENGSLEYDCFLKRGSGPFFWGLLLLVSGRVLPRYIGIKASVNQPSWNVIRVWFTLLILLSVNPSPISRFGPCAMRCNVPWCAVGMIGNAAKVPEKGEGQLTIKKTGLRGSNFFWGGGG